MIVIHHLGISQSERILWLCEELGVPYELRRYERDPVTRLAPSAYRALHPLGTAPIIEDGDLVLAESGAIVDYILARYAGGRLAIGPDSAAFGDYLFWLHFANGSLMPGLMADLVVRRLSADPAAASTSPMAARVTRAFDAIERRLAQVPWFAGEAFTAADIMMVFPLTTMRAFAQRDLSAFPAIRAYLQRIGERPAYRAAMAKGDPGFTPLLT